MRRGAYGRGRGYWHPWRVSPGRRWSYFNDEEEVASLRKETAMLREELAEMEKRLESIRQGEV